MSETQVSLMGGIFPHFVHLVSHAEYVWELLSMGHDEFICKRPAIDPAESLWQFVEGVRWAFDHYGRHGDEIERRRQFQLFEINGQTWASASRAVCYMFVDPAMQVFEIMELGQSESDIAGVRPFWCRKIDRDLWTQRVQFCDFREIELATIDFQRLREACRQEWTVIPETVEESDSPKQKVSRDKKTEARDKWIYEECCKGIAHDSIARKMPKKNPKWSRISTKQGIFACAKRYAQRNKLPEPPPRQER